MQAVIYAVGPTVAALVGAVISWGNRRRAEEVKEQNSIAIQQNNAIITKTDEIHELANSNLTAIQAELIQANQKIARLENALISKQDELDKAKEP